MHMLADDLESFRHASSWVALCFRAYCNIAVCHDERLSCEDLSEFHKTRLQQSQVFEVGFVHIPVVNSRCKCKWNFQRVIEFTAGKLKDEELELEWMWQVDCLRRRGGNKWIL